MTARVIRSAGRFLGLDRPAVGYALALFLAATLAFGIASQLHVQNAYWAAMPIWVVAQAQRGLMVERAVFRVVGTLVGSAAGFAILTLLHEPFLALAILCVWIALTAGLTHMLRRANSYAALMAGITAAVVVLPSLLSAKHSLELAVARVECTLIGVVVVTIVTGLVTPNSQRDAFYGRVRLLAAEVVSYVAHVLQRNEHDESEQRILAEITEVEAAADMALAGSIEGYRRIRHVNAFVAASLALMAAAQTMKRRSEQQGAASSVSPRVLMEFADRLHTDRPRDAVDADLYAVLEKTGLGATQLGEALVQLLGALAALCSPKTEKIRAFGKNSITLAPRYE
ncbi:MAG TPA: FUSC family protein, partial [Eoetvoesiella sp.]